MAMAAETLLSQPRPKFLEGFDPKTLSKGELYPGEIFWRDHCDWLKTHGYVLRARYQPDWVASWLKEPSKKMYMFCEDGTPSRWPHLLDATRVSDGKQVIIKQVRPSKDPEEVNIARLFSSEPLASDTRNHCIPLYEALNVPDEDDMVLLVMPLLQNFKHPHFDTIGEAVEMFHQIFEGLQFMHKNNTSHCDCKLNNIMMDGTSLYAGPLHPLRQDFKFDYSGKLLPETRTRKPVKYYLIDFGLSRQYDPNSPSESRLLPCGYGGDSTVPEFAKDQFCDPFAVDVYCIGNIIRECFLEGDIHNTVTPNRGFRFMKKLVADMVQDDPKARPTMDEVIQRFDVIVRRLSSWKLRSRVPKSTEPRIIGVFRAIPHWQRQIGLMWKRVPAIPKP